jgi:hypothetical protein
MRPTPGDPNVPSMARCYDYLLDGKASLEVDRKEMDKVLALAPETKDLALDNRTFLVEAITYVAQQGVKQFLDIGSGLPTQHNTHQAAQAIVPEARTVYVDNDISVLPYAEQLIVGDPNTAYCQADLRDPRSILTHPDTVRLLDFTEPVALLLVAVLHFIKEAEGPYDLVQRLLDDLPPGSYLIASHVTMDDMAPDVRALVQAGIDAEADYTVWRNRDQFMRFYDGLEIVSSGVTDVGAWSPNGMKHVPKRSIRCYGAVARKP